MEKMLVIFFRVVTLCDLIRRDHGEPLFVTIRNYHSQRVKHFSTQACTYFACIILNLLKQMSCCLQTNVHNSREKINLLQREKLDFRLRKTSGSTNALVALSRRQSILLHEWVYMGGRKTAQTRSKTQLQLARRLSISGLVGWASSPPPPLKAFWNIFPLTPLPSYHRKGPGAGTASPLSKHIFHYGV